MKIRSVPQLRFYYDDSAEKGAHMSALIARAVASNTTHEPVNKQVHQSTDDDTGEQAYQPTDSDTDESAASYTDKPGADIHKT